MKLLLKTTLTLVALLLSSAAFAQGAAKRPIQISDQQKRFIVEANQWVKTDCFEFRVMVRSQISDTGCRVRAYVAGAKTKADAPPTLSPYFQLETTLADPGLIPTLEAHADALLEVYAKSSGKPPASSTSTPGRYDTYEGKYLGSAKEKIAGQAAVMARWGLALEKGVAEGKVDCPKPDAVSSSSPFKAYASVTTRFISTIPVDRYFSQGKPHRYLVGSGMQKDCLSPYVNFALSSLRFIP